MTVRWECPRCGTPWHHERLDERSRWEFIWCDECVTPAELEAALLEAVFGEGA